MQDMYIKHGMYKNYEEYCYLVLEEEVYFILLGLLVGSFSLETDASCVPFLFFSSGQ
jgi:hypothetical protein